MHPETPRPPIQPPILLLMVGPPGAGKTFFSRQFAERNGFTRVNSDDIREKYFPELLYTLDQRENVYAKLAEVTATLLHDGASVIFDGNLLTNRERREALTRYRTTGAHVLFLNLDIAPPTALQRATLRDVSEDNGSAGRLHQLHDSFEPFDPELPHITVSGTEPYERAEATVLKSLGRGL